MTHSERSAAGIPVSPGIAIGRVHLHTRRGIGSVTPRTLPKAEVEPEVHRFLRAISLSRDQLARIRRQMTEVLDEKHAEIFTAQAMFLEDPDLVDSTIEAIRAERKNAEFLFHRRINEFASRLRGVEDEFFRARDNDALDIANRVLNNLLPRADDDFLALPTDTVIVASELGPSDVAALLRHHILGIVLEKGGPTSHTAIMAKAIEIPAVIGVPDITSHASQGTKIIVDGIEGKVIVNPTRDTISFYTREQSTFLAFERELDELRDQPAETIDGYTVALRANVELPEEVEHVAAHGARGIGLFRTEFIFMNRPVPPGQEEQFEIYRDVVQKIAPQSVVFRTIDVGGDKFLSMGNVAHELNPFMGQRAVRLSLNNPEMFQDQLRAMLRASAFGPVKVLIPMISGLEEFLEVKKHFKHAKAELRRLGVEFDPRVPLGAMIEVPSAAVVADLLAQECDFFSIGTNDLIQYTLAVDRGNQSVAYLYEPLHPAILRLLQNIIMAARKNGIPVTLCGEIGGDPMMAVLLTGMGVDELSMSAVSVPAVKRIIRTIRLPEAKLLAEEALTQNTIHGVHKIVRRRMRNYIKSNKVHRSHLLHLSEDTKH